MNIEQVVSESIGGNGWNKGLPRKSTDLEDEYEKRHDTYIAQWRRLIEYQLERSGSQYGCKSMSYRK